MCPGINRKPLGSGSRLRGGAAFHSSAPLIFLLLLFSGSVAVGENKNQPGQVAIRGSVQDAAGRALAGAVVELMQDHPKLHGWMRVTGGRTDGDGNYKLEFLLPENKPVEKDGQEKGPAPAVEPARYSLQFAHSGFKTRLEPLDTSGAESNAREPVILETVEERRASVAVFCSRKQARINPLLYGSNVGLWHAEDFSNPQVAEATREMGVTFIRYPGGGRSQSVRWQREEAEWYKPPRSGPGDCVLTPRSVRTFIEFCRAVQAEPLITLNLELLDLENVLDLVRFLNVENDFRVKYFEIGNEPESYMEKWGLGKNWSSDPASFRKTYQRVAELHLQWSAALRKISPACLTLGPVSANANFYGIALPPFWEQIKEHLDILAIHRYPQTDLKGNPEQHMEDARLLEVPLEWSELAAEIKVTNDRFSPTHRPLTAVTEWHTCYGNPGPRQQQIVGALFVARNLCEMARNGIAMAHVWVMTGCGYYDVFSKRPDGTVEKHLPYHAFRILAGHFRGTMVECTSDNKSLAAYAVVDDDGLSLALINTSPDTLYRCSVAVEGPSLKPTAAYRMELTQPYVELPRDGFVQQAVLPAYSLTLLRYGKSEQKKKRDRDRQ